MLTHADLRREAGATGYQLEFLEKVLRLFELLERFHSHPFLKTRVALKGGTALNLFVFDTPRLSIDVDFNYTGAADRETMLRERPRIEQAISAVCGRLGIGVKRVPDEHAGGKWRLSYESVTGRGGTLELDVNFLLRTPLWPLVTRDSKRLGSFGATAVRMLDVHELAAGKLAALFGRSAARDLFDARELLATIPLDTRKLRLGFVVYGGFNRRDWRRVALDDVQADPADVGQTLMPLLRAAAVPARSRLGTWTERLVVECRELLSVVLPLTSDEVEFLERLNEYGEIVPGLLTADSELQEKIQAHPGLRWKALNVLKHRGLPSANDE